MISENTPEIPEHEELTAAEEADMETFAEQLRADASEVGPINPREMEMYMKGQADMAERIQYEQDAIGTVEPTVNIAVKPSDDPESPNSYDVIATVNVGNTHVAQVRETCVLNGILVARDNARRRALSILDTIRTDV